MSSQSSLSGFLLINKPSGITSHDVIDRIRCVTQERRIGHSGTLDPFATGLLIIGVGREATKQLDQFLKMDKEYRAVLHLGATSTTGDPTGTIIAHHPGHGQDPSIGFWPSQNDVTKVLKKYIGPQQQIPPMFSAKKVGGKKLYQLARKGQTIPRQPISITISHLDLVRYGWPELEITVRCSSGTYIRTLGEDIGKTLGCGAYVQELERTAIGPHQLKDAVKLDMLTPEHWNEHLRGSL